MQLKPITAIIVLLLVVTSLSLAGCVTPSTESHPDSTLKAFVTEYHAQFTQMTDKNPGKFAVSQWEETWINDTAVNIGYQEEQNFSITDFHSSQVDDTIKRFATIADASEFVKNTCNRWNQTSEGANVYMESFVYNKSTGHFPSVFLYCSYPGSEDHNAPGYSVFQLDNIVMYSVGTPIPTDLSSYFDKTFEGGNAIVDRPFTKSTNQRGNDVYKGVTRNSSLPMTSGVTTVIELTKSQAEAKQLYDQTVAQKQSEGFTYRPDWTASFKAQSPQYNEVWIGQNGLRQFSVMYFHDPHPIHSWEFIAEAS